MFSGESTLSITGGDFIQRDSSTFLLTKKSSAFLDGGSVQIGGQSQFSVEEDSEFIVSDGTASFADGATITVLSGTLQVSSSKKRQASNVSMVQRVLCGGWEGVGGSVCRGEANGAAGGAVHVSQ